jgi:hypothetical protein
MYLPRLGLLTLTVALMAACTSTAPPSATPTPSGGGGSQSPSSASPSADSVGESLSWTGAASGYLSEAIATCELPGLDVIDMHAPDNGVDISLPSHSAGVVTQSQMAAGVNLHLSDGVDGYTLFLASSGSVTYMGKGDSGSMDVSLVPQSNAGTSITIHLTGTWRC